MSLQELPFSQACENNKEPILQVLKRHIAEQDEPGQLLEIGGGTGQHAVFFANAFPRLRWQATDVAANIASLNLRISQAGLHNLPLALPLDVQKIPWPVEGQSSIFTANTLHIMSLESVIAFFAELGNWMGGLADSMNDNAKVFIYGPFKYAGEFTTPSNAQFDMWLKQRDPVSGIRDFETIAELADTAGLSLIEDNAMPANNQLLVWGKKQRRK